MEDKILELEDKTGIKEKPEEYLGKRRVVKGIWKNSSTP
jgi:hypothetical protein